MRIRLYQSGMLSTFALLVPMWIGPAQAENDLVRISSLAIEQQGIREMPGGARTASAYMKISNDGSGTDWLIGGSSSVSTRVEVHEVHNVGQVMRTRAIAGGLEISGHKSVELKPGSYQLVFVGLNAPLQHGEWVEASLKFQNAGHVKVKFQVVAPGPTGEEKTATH
jgi:periplasmic copper chaperone A